MATTDNIRLFLTFRHGELEHEKSLDIAENLMKQVWSLVAKKLQMSKIKISYNYVMSSQEPAQGKNDHTITVEYPLNNAL